VNCTRQTAAHNSLLTNHNVKDRCHFAPAFLALVSVAFASFSVAAVAVWGALYGPRFPLSNIIFQKNDAEGSICPKRRSNP
jgi:hypothetical protein